MNTNEKFVSPTGTAEWPRLNTPDTKFNPEGDYKVTLVIPAKGNEKFLQFLDEQHAAAVQVIKEENPGKKMKTADAPYSIDENTGDIKVRFKMKAKITSKKTGKTYDMKPILVDASGAPCPTVEVKGGSRIKVSFSCAPYYTALVGAGLSLRLVGVQVLKLGEGGSGAATAAALGFSAEEGFVAAEEESEQFGGKVAAAKVEEEDDNGGDF